MLSIAHQMPSSISLNLKKFLIQFSFSCKDICQLDFYQQINHNSFCSIDHLLLPRFAETV